MTSKRLSSDILEQQFGPTALTVLHQDQSTRIICTKVIASGQVLELSLVSFIHPAVDQFPAVHQDIINGQSMGKAFRSHGIDFSRQVHAAYHRVLPTTFGQWFGSVRPASVVDVTITAGADQTTYARILELYSPAVVWPGLSGEPTAAQLTTIEQLDTFLQNKTS